jgi:hypothetical protein
VTELFLEDAVENTGYGNVANDMLEESGDRVQVVEDGEESTAAAVLEGGAYSDRTMNVMENFYLNTIPYDLIMHIVRYELLETTSKQIGAILIFVPGMEEIRRVIGMLEGCRELSGLSVALPMHSSLSFDDLQKAFRRPKPGMRKIIVSTNICETGVTIEDVDLVVDTGFVKSVEWNEVTELSRLRMHYCSVAESLQRRGRAGRVRAGRCYHLFPKSIFRPAVGKAADGNVLYSFSMKARPDPEMARAPLTSPILNLIDQEFEPALLMSAVGNTVKPSKLKNALNTLIELGAVTVLDQLEDISPATSNSMDGLDSLSYKYKPTALGRMLAVLPCDPRSGKILLAARKLGCLPSAAVYVASLDCKNVFMRTSFSDSFYRDRFMKNTESDAAAIVNAYSEWLGSSSKHKWCRENGISMPAMVQVDGITKDLVKALESRGGTQAASDSSNQAKTTYCHTCKHNVGMHTCITGGSLEALIAAIASGMGNNISFRSSPPESSRLTFTSDVRKGGSHCVIGKSSLVQDPGDWILYCGKMANDSGRQSVSNVTAVSPSIAVLFSPWTKYFIGDGTIIVGTGIGVKIRPQSLVALRKLKAAWDSLLCDDAVLCSNYDESQLMDVIRRYIIT